MTDGGHCEVELFGPDHDGRGARWRPVTASLDDATPAPLAFGSLSAARGYAERDRPGPARIIWVTEEGERLVVETLDA